MSRLTASRCAPAGSRPPGVVPPAAVPLWPSPLWLSLCGRSLEAVALWSSRWRLVGLGSSGGDSFDVGLSAAVSQTIEGRVIQPGFYMIIFRVLRSSGGRSALSRLTSKVDDSAFHMSDCKCLVVSDGGRCGRSPSAIRPIYRIYHMRSRNF